MICPEKMETWSLWKPEKRWQLEYVFELEMSNQKEIFKNQEIRINLEYILRKMKASPNVKEKLDFPVYRWAGSTCLCGVHTSLPQYHVDSAINSV